MHAPYRTEWLHERSCAAVWRQGMHGHARARSAGRHSAEGPPAHHVFCTAVTLHTDCGVHTARAPLLRRASQSCHQCGAASGARGGRGGTFQAADASGGSQRLQACPSTQRETKAVTHAYLIRAEAGREVDDKKSRSSSCCVAPLACALQKRKQALTLVLQVRPFGYKRVAGYWWWGASRSGQDLDRTLRPQIQPPPRGGTPGVHKPTGSCPLPNVNAVKAKSGQIWNN